MATEQDFLLKFIFVFWCLGGENILKKPIPLRAPHGRRSLHLISYHAKSLEAFVLGIEDDHSALEIVVDAFKPC